MILDRYLGVVEFDRLKIIFVLTEVVNISVRQLPGQLEFVQQLCQPPAPHHCTQLEDQIQQLIVLYSLLIQPGVHVKQKPDDQVKFIWVKVLLLTVVKGLPTVGVALRPALPTDFLIVNNRLQIQKLLMKHHLLRRCEKVLCIQQVQVKQRVL